MPPENVRKPLVFLCFQGVEKRNIGPTWIEVFPYRNNKTGEKQSNYGKMHKDWKIHELKV